MAYMVITTRPPGDEEYDDELFVVYDEGGREWDRDRSEIAEIARQRVDRRRESRRAVATLEEARHHLIDTVADAVTLDCAPGRLTAAGGTIGPLPDGTTIKVEQLTRRAIVEDLLVDFERLRNADWPWTTDTLVDAWNAKHGTEA